MLISARTFSEAMRRVGFTQRQSEHGFLIYTSLNGEEEVWTSYTSKGEVETRFALEDIGTWSQDIQSQVRDVLIRMLEQEEV